MVGFYLECLRTDDLCVAWLDQHLGLLAMLGALCRKLAPQIKDCKSRLLEEQSRYREEEGVVYIILENSSTEVTQKSDSEAEHDAYIAARDSVDSLQELVTYFEDHAEAGMGHKFSHFYHPC